MCVMQIFSALVREVDLVWSVWHDLESAAPTAGKCARPDWPSYASMVHCMPVSHMGCSLCQRVIRETRTTVVQLVSFVGHGQAMDDLGRWDGWGEQDQPFRCLSALPQRYLAMAVVRFTWAWTPEGRNVAHTSGN